MAPLPLVLLPLVATQIRLHITPKTTADPAGVRIAASGQTTVWGNRLVRTFAGGRALVLRGNDCRIFVLGRVDRLTIAGDRNMVNLSGVGSIVLSGQHNRVRWGAESRGHKPKITDRGRGNTVTRQ